MKTLKKYPNLTIKEVAELTGQDRKKLRDAQLEFLKKHVKRDSVKWEDY